MLWYELKQKKILSLPSHVVNSESDSNPAGMPQVTRGIPEKCQLLLYTVVLKKETAVQYQ